MDRYDWSRLNHLQIGKYAEYLVKMEFVLYGFDVYSSEVDDRGIDFVIRRANDCYYDIQVKSARNMNYIFFRKDRFVLADNLFAAIVMLQAFEPPELFLIPSVEWLAPNRLLVSRDYEGKKSAPEWGLNLSQSTYKELRAYFFESMVEALL